MNIDINIVATVSSILVVAGGFFWFVVGRILTDKKDKLTLEFEIQRLKDDVHELKATREEIEALTRQINIIQEQIKHL